MKNNKILLAVLAIALVLGMTACSNGSTGGSKKKETPPNTDPKFITITGIPSGFMGTLKTNGVLIALIPAGTDLSALLSLGSQEEAMEAFMALIQVSTFISVEDWGSWLATLTDSLPDCNLWDTTNKKWTGTGTFDVILSDLEGSSVYRASSVAFSEEKTTVAWSKFTAVE
jgi:hypothetical protein